MKTIPPALPETEDEPFAAPLTADEVRRLRERHPPVSPWWVVAGQVAVGLLAALAAAVLTGKHGVGWSLAYGALAVAIPAGVFARALGRRASSRNAGAGFLMWELVKIALTLALLVVAPKVVPGLNWLALLAGMILATKMYWVALVFRRRPQRNGN